MKSEDSLKHGRTGVPVNTKDLPDREGTGGHDSAYFRPEGVLSKVHMEGVVLLGGGYAVLLQLAHPFVAAGVDDYSNFQAEILKRLYGTVVFMHRLVFGDSETVHKALIGFHAMHARIRGKLKHRAGGRYSAEASYSGEDPEAMLWVFATFVDTGRRAYETFVRPLSPQEKQQYHAESLVLGRLMGVPEDLLPQTPQLFQEYMNDMVSGDALAITETTKRLGRAVLYPKVGFFAAISAFLLRFVTTGFLHERFRKAYGLRWNKRKQKALYAFSSLIRLLRPVAPGWIWKSPLQGGKLTYFLLWGTGSAAK